MNKQQVAVYEIQLRLINERLERMENTSAPAAPSVNNWLTAIVSTSPESLDAVLYSVAGMVIGFPASVASTALGGDGASALQVWGTITAAGVGLGVVRLAVGAVDLTGALEMLADKAIAYKERRNEKGINPLPASTRDLPINHSKGTIITAMPEVTQIERGTKTIPSCNTADGWRVIEIDRLCAYLKYITNTKARTKDGRPKHLINQKEWPDVRDYFKSRSWWNLPHNSPTLPRACLEMRGRATNGTDQTRTNDGTGEK